MITKVFNIEHPIFAIPSPLYATAELVAGASEAGALGVFPSFFQTPEEIRETVSVIRRMTNKPFGILLAPPQRKKATPNLVRYAVEALRPIRESYHLPEPNLEIPSFDEQFQVVLDLNVPVVGNCLGGFREPYMEALEEKGVKSFGIASNLRDAKVLESSGVQAIVIKGWESSGLISNSEVSDKESLIGSEVLREECLRALRTPVLVDTALHSFKTVKRFFEDGCRGIALSDALIGADENGLPPDWLELLRYTTDSSSTVSGFTYGHPARVLRNQFINELEEAEFQVLPFPQQWFLMKDIFEKAKSSGRLQDYPLDFGQLGYQFHEGPIRKIIEEYASLAKENTHE